MNIFSLAIESYKVKYDLSTNSMKNIFRTRNVKKENISLTLIQKYLMEYKIQIIVLLLAGTW